MVPNVTASLPVGADPRAVSRSRDSRAFPVVSAGTPLVSGTGPLPKAVFYYDPEHHRPSYISDPTVSTQLVYQPPRAATASNSIWNCTKNNTNTADTDENAEGQQQQEQPNPQQPEPTATAAVATVKAPTAVFKSKKPTQTLPSASAPPTHTAGDNATSDKPQGKQLIDTSNNNRTTSNKLSGKRTAGQAPQNEPEKPRNSKQQQQHHIQQQHLAEEEANAGRSASPEEIDKTHSLDLQVQDAMDRIEFFYHCKGVEKTEEEYEALRLIVRERVLTDMASIQKKKRTPNDDNGRSASFSSSRSSIGVDGMPGLWVAMLDKYGPLTRQQNEVCNLNQYYQAIFDDADDEIMRLGRSASPMSSQQKHRPYTDFGSPEFDRQSNQQQQQGGIDWSP